MLKLQVNGKKRNFSGPPFKRLIDVLREDFGLTGTKEGCGEGECGACTVLIGGEPVNSCLIPVCQAQGRPIETIESLGTPKKLNELQQSFLEKGGAQCGICTPGMLMTAWAWIKNRGSSEPSEIRTALAGNLCRCTGYQHIVDSVVDAMTKKARSPKKLALIALLALSPSLARARKDVAWKTFPSAALGAQIDAPTDWEQETGDKVLRLLAPSRDTGASITLSREPGEIDQAANVSKAAIASQGGKIRAERNSKVGGYAARTLEFQTNDGEPVRGKMTFVDFGGRVYMVDCEANKRDYPKFESAFDRAIASIAPLGGVAAAKADAGFSSEPSETPSPLDALSSPAPSPAPSARKAPPEEAAPAPTEPPAASSSWTQHRDNRSRIMASAPSDWLAGVSEGAVLGARRPFLFLHPADWKASRARVALFSQADPIADAQAWAKSAVLSLNGARIQREVAIKLPSGKQGFVIVFNDNPGPNAELGILTLIPAQGRTLVADCRAKTGDFGVYNEAFNRIVESVDELEKR